jgi:hypothetical protein
MCGANTLKILKCCCILHNYIKLHGDAVWDENLGAAQQRGRDCSTFRDNQQGAPPTRDDRARKRDEIADNLEICNFKGPKY